MLQITGIETGALEQKLRRVRFAGQSAAPLMRQVGTAITDEVRENFNQSGRPRWRANAPSTIRGKGHAKPLVSHRGRPSNLEKSVVIIQPTRVEVRTIPEVRDYARIHQHGGRAGRNRSVRIPARPYRILRLSRALRARIVGLARAYFRRAA